MGCSDTLLEVDSEERNRDNSTASTRDRNPTVAASIEGILAESSRRRHQRPSSVQSAQTREDTVLGRPCSSISSVLIVGFGTT